MNCGYRSASHVKQKEKQRAGEYVGRGYHKRFIGMNSVPAGADRRTLAPLIAATGLGAARERVTVTHHSILVQEPAVTEGSDYTASCKDGNRRHIFRRLGRARWVKKL